MYSWKAREDRRKKKEVLYHFFWLRYHLRYKYIESDVYINIPHSHLMIFVERKTKWTPTTEIYFSWFSNRICFVHFSSFSFSSSTFFSIFFPLLGESQIDDDVKRLRNTREKAKENERIVQLRIETKNAHRHSSNAFSQLDIIIGFRYAKRD